MVAVFDFELKLRILLSEELRGLLSGYCATEEFAVRLFNCCDCLVDDFYDGTGLILRISFLKRTKNRSRLTVLPLHLNSRL